MTALHAAVADAIDLSEPLSVESAYDLSHRAALAESALGPVGLEIEAHLFDLDAVPERVGLERLSPLLDRGIPTSTEARRRHAGPEPI